MNEGMVIMEHNESQDCRNTGKNTYMYEIGNQFHKLWPSYTLKNAILEGQRKLLIMIESEKYIACPTYYYLLPQIHLYNHI